MTDHTAPSPVLPSPDSNGDRPAAPVDVRPAWVVPCPELDPAIQTFREAGFALLAIGPADDPRWAMMSNSHEPHGTSLRLDTQAFEEGRRHAFLEVDEGDRLLGSDQERAFPPAVVAARADRPVEVAGTPSSFVDGSADEWIVGRAGMRYRDLLPGRWDGQFIASHIHIPEGGPVPDYVHYHHVDFQLIFCHRGWVRVVYQDQGDPFVLNPGDAILQAPGIRHRVLEASDDLYVVEVSSPAEHATFVEHGFDLPNGVASDRWYGGQRYVHHEAKGSPWNVVGPGVRVQPFGLETATGGRYGAAVVEMDPDDGGNTELPLHDTTDFEFVTVLDGSMNLTDTDGQTITTGTGAGLGIDGSVMWRAEPTEPTRLLAVHRYRI